MKKTKKRLKYLRPLLLLAFLLALLIPQKDYAIELISAFAKNTEAEKISGKTLESSWIETSESADSEAVAESTTADTSLNIKSSVRLDVPLLNQMAEPMLYNGCEVTSLAMLLSYWDISVSKNQLADELPSISLIDSAGLYGDPNTAFIGDITGVYDAGYFVYHEPIYELAQDYMTPELEVIDLTGETFAVLQEYLSQGCPIWIITTTTFARTSDMETWQTANGSVEVSMSEHCVVLTGYDEAHVFVNDPCGSKNSRTGLEDFVASWKQMGGQAIAVAES